MFVLLLLLSPLVIYIYKYFFFLLDLRVPTYRILLSSKMNTKIFRKIKVLLRTKPLKIYYVIWRNQSRIFFFYVQWNVLELILGICKSRTCSLFGEFSIWTKGCCSYEKILFIIIKDKLSRKFKRKNIRLWYKWNWGIKIYFQLEFPFLLFCRSEWRAKAILTRLRKTYNLVV